jgi:hypothetical protein
MTITDRRGGIWEVRNLGGGVEERTKIGGFGSGHEYRVMGPAASRSRPARRRSAQARSTAKPITGVVLTAQARQAIIDELLRFDDGPHEARETGGHLIGRLDGSTLTVNYAFGAGPGAIHDFGRLSLDLGYTRSVQNACADGEVICGLWHSHFGRPDPSRQDLAHWAGEARYFRGLSFKEPAYLGLIATTSGSDWLYPRFHAWMSWGDKHRADPIELEVQRWRQ